MIQKMQASIQKVFLLVKLLLDTIVLDSRLAY